MQAKDRTLKVWFERVRSGQLRLPRFQRGEAWEADNVEGLLDSVLKGLPAGAALVLEVGRDEPFITRRLAGAPEPEEDCTEQLLDGQQRLTALWKSLQDLYEDQMFLAVIKKPEPDQDGIVPPRVRRFYRWTKSDGRRFPLWLDQPTEVYARGLVPVSLLQPDDVSSKRLDWLKAAIGEDYRAILEVEQTLSTLRDRIKHFNFPLLALPVDTPKSTALDVFVKMNSSAVSLTSFDIVVAQFEAMTGESMHELMSDLRERVPALKSYISPEQLVLQAFALKANKPPTYASLQEREFKLPNLKLQWEEIVSGARWTLDLLEAEGVHDGARLPTVIVIPVLVALHADIPDRLDAAGNAKSLVRSYLWRSFTTKRYEAGSAGRALQDYRGLRDALPDPSKRNNIPIFDKNEYPFPNEEDIKGAGWPKRKDTLARAILALTLRGGAYDIADGAIVSRSILVNREYHHLFPRALLTGRGHLTEAEANRALNCALITMATNRNVAAKQPLLYLAERISRSDLGEAEVRQRLESHLIPFEALRGSDYEALHSDTERTERIKSDYNKFLSERAAMVLARLEALWEGRQV